MNIGEWIEKNSIVLNVPLFLYIVLYAFVVLSWVFKTTFYDNFKDKHLPNYCMYYTLLWLGLLTIIMGKYWSWINPFTISINLDILLTLVVILIAKMFLYIKKHWL